MKYFIVLGLALMLLFPAVCVPADDDSLAELKRIKKRIEQTAGSLDKQKSAEKDLVRDLSVVATTIKQSKQRINSIRLEKKKTSRQLEDARLNLKQSNREMAQLRKKLHRRLVALYKEGETGPLKLFFSSVTPMELAQQYQYLSVILEHDRELLDEFRVGIEQQSERQRQIELLLSEQDALLEREKKNRRDAEQARQLYSQILQRVKKDQKSLQQELKRLESRARNLEKLVKQLDSPVVTPPQGGNFAALKGRLSWPVKGRIMIGFGTQHNEDFGSVLESHGVEISYRQAQPVKAVAQGRIVFASWFKGYGNLMIVAHDDGYHTLYAQAERLEGSVGDDVLKGETIAWTGEPADSGIYFEIRHNGSPIDPMQWLGAN